MSLERRETVRHDAFEPEAAGAPRSNSWLLADSAFAAPQRAPLSPTAVVTIRRSRLVVQAPGEAAAERGAAESAWSDKGPRVFRVDATPGDAPTARADAVEAAPQLPALVTTAPVPRKQRVASDKRPGPVLRIVPPPQERAVAPEAVPQQVATPSPTPRQECDALVVMMAEVQALLDDIRSARSWHFMPGLQTV